MIILECTELVVGYSYSNQIGPLSFNLRRGELCLVEGPNGSGKSTLVRTILGVQRRLAGRIKRRGAISGISDSIWSYRNLQRGDFLASLSKAAPFRLLDSLLSRSNTPCHEGVPVRLWNQGERWLFFCAVAIWAGADCILLDEIGRAHV